MSLNIILLFGGESNERFVSVASAQSMATALNKAQLWFWHNEGPIYLVEHKELQDHRDSFTKEFIPSNPPIFKTINEALSSDQAKDNTFVLALHGGKGENGTLQELLEKYHLAFTGSDATGSRLAFDKLETKKALANFPIKMAAQKILNNQDLKRQLIDFMDQFGATVVKPVCGGSSLGCFFLKSKDQIDAVIPALLAHAHEDYFCEQLIKGRELTVGVIESENGTLALPVTEIVVDHSRDFDYEGKYLGAGTKELTPADISESATREAQRLAVAAHTALSLYGYSRTDMILTQDGMYFLEINTLPGLTKESLVPQQLAIAHISITEFLKGQIKLAEERLNRL